MCDSGSNPSMVVLAQVRADPRSGYSHEFRLQGEMTVVVGAYQPADRERNVKPCATSLSSKPRKEKTMVVSKSTVLRAATGATRGLGWNHSLDPSSVKVATWCRLRGERTLRPEQVPCAAAAFKLSDLGMLC